MNKLTWWKRPIAWLAQLASVTAVEPGRPNDGLTFMPSSGTQLDKPWHELRQEFSDAREAWRKNPLARRMIGLITAYVVGPEINLSSKYSPLQRFIVAFWNHEQNQMPLRLHEWSDELARSGELFPILFTNAIDGMSYVRVMPASQIQEVKYKDGDYEFETGYLETRPMGEDDKVWASPNSATIEEPVMLHFAINRPIGELRGESDLAPMLIWLRRYTAWLEDRVRMNAAVRAFLWIVKAPARLHSDLRTRYARPPESGSIVIAEESESWEVVAPNLHANDAEKDGNAIKRMIAAGGPGLTLTDIGHAESTGLNGGNDSDEQRRRFLLRRQRYFCYALASVVVTAYNRWVDVGHRKYRKATIADIQIEAPDISTEDNSLTSTAAKELITGMIEAEKLFGESVALKNLTLRMFIRITGEAITEEEFDAILKGTKQNANQSINPVPAIQS